MSAGGIVVAFAFARAWMFTALGLLATNAQTASGYTFHHPLAFISGAFVPAGTMPEWLEPVARHQPLNVIVEATPGLILAGYADAASPLLALAWIAGMRMRGHGHARPHRL